ncbi:extracellular solute-binding protein [Mycoplasmopsis ciconiae]|uniref:Extracellular solute-binding protein n=1 Tax=Mycoplasmopsis ciconiae TaxID=561067 RepID=A0ABU7MME0_9BACT|nr:extracellular solute-binding protein [Mycoplasmopsis ciconiae]
MKFKMKKASALALSGVSVLSAGFLALSCSSNSEANDPSNGGTQSAYNKPFSKIFDQNKAQLEELKTRLNGYSKGSFEIFTNKAEIADQSNALIQEFNKFFGTNLKWTQIGGSNNYQTALSGKFSNGVNGVLLVGAESKSAFEQINNIVVDTSAKKFLNNFDKSTDDIIVGEKHFMPQAFETYGVIYNKTLFKNAKITVYEGKSFDTAAAELKQGLQKPENYDGSIEKDGTLYVFSGDMTFSAYNKVLDKLRAANIKPFYSVSKTDKQNVWPITNHLMNSVVVASTAGSDKPGTPAFEKMNEDIMSSPQNIFTADLVTKLQKALEIYNTNGANSVATNTVNDGMTLIGSNGVAMIQNGTWGFSQALQVAKQSGINLELGFLPIPVENARTNKMAIYKGATQRWGATTLTNDEANKKLAQLFLQFLYQTQAGTEILQNYLGSANPYTDPNKPFQGEDQLINSSYNYGDLNSDVWAMSTFPAQFNNDTPALVDLANKGFKPEGQTNEQVAQELLKVWNSLRQAEKEKQAK